MPITTPVPPAARALCQVVEACPLFTKVTAPTFIGILFDVLTEECKALPFPTAAKGGRGKPAAKGAEGKSEDEVEADEEAAVELVERTHELCKAFVQLVQSTKVVDFRKKDGTSKPAGRALNKKAIIASHRFVGMLNKHMLPLMTEHFARLSGDIMSLLKAVQPATRLLQVHCTMVKERQQIAALQPAAILKRELESLIFQVKVLLQSNKCDEGFWMGNLKHKSISGHEVSSQMAVEVGEPKEPKGKGKGKKRKAEEEDKDDDGEYAAPMGSQVVELDEEDDEVDEGDEGDEGDGEEDLEEEDEDA